MMMLGLIVHEFFASGVSSASAHGSTSLMMSKRSSMTSIILSSL